MSGRVQRNEAIRIKEEYHAFRDRNGVLLFVFAASLLFALQRAGALMEKGELHHTVVLGKLGMLLTFRTLVLVAEMLLPCTSKRQVVQVPHFQLRCLQLRQMHTCRLQGVCMCSWLLMHIEM